MLGDSLRRQETAEAVAMLVACPYCLAARGESCRPRYAGENMAAWGHKSRSEAARRLADQPAPHTFDEAFGEE